MDITCIPTMDILLNGILNSTAMQILFWFPFEIFF